MLSRILRYLLTGVGIAGLTIALPSAGVRGVHLAPRAAVGLSGQAVAMADADWRIAGHLPYPRIIRPAVTVGRDGKIYVFGGMDKTNGYNVFNTTFIYNPRTNRWTRGADMAIAREGAQAVTLPDGRLIVLGVARDAPTHHPPSCVSRPAASMRTTRAPINGAPWRRCRLHGIASTLWCVRARSMPLAG